MLYKLGKELFKIIINFFQILRVALIFLAFATTLYWFMQLAGATFFDFITAFFESIKNFMHLFYNRTTQIDTVAIDFSFLLAAFLMLGISWGLKYLVEELELWDKRYESMHTTLKKRDETIFNLHLENQYKQEENKNKNILILIKIVALNLAKDSTFNKDFNVGVDEKQDEVTGEFVEIISGKIKCKKRSSKNELLISFTPFEGVDGVISELYAIVKTLKEKYKLQRWKVDFYMAIETYATEDEAATKMMNLKKLIRLGFREEIACLSTFMQRYSLLDAPKYAIDGKGLYTINDKEETVFCIEKISFT